MPELRHEQSPAAAEATAIEIPRRTVELLALFSFAMELGEELSYPKHAGNRFSVRSGRMQSDGPNERISRGTTPESHEN